MSDELKLKIEKALIAFQDSLYEKYDDDCHLETGEEHAFRSGYRAAMNTRHTPEAVKGVVEALEGFIAHEIEYMTLNRLGDPEKQDRVIEARAALKAYKIHIGE